MCMHSMGSCRESGFSLVELVISIVIVGVGLAGLMGTLNLTTQHSADPMMHKQAIAMAEAIMEEVLAKDYAATLPETDLANCSNRKLYVGVDDYNCFAGPPYIQGDDGGLGSSPIAALAGYQAKVVVTPVTVSGAAMKKVTVTVTGGVDTIDLFGYRASY